MSTDNTQGTDTTPTANAADTANAGTRPVDAASGQVDLKSLIAARDALKQEFKALQAELAGMRTQTQTKPEPTSKTDGDSLALAELAFRDALDDLEDVKLDKGQKNLLRRLYRAEKPSDPAAWLADAVSSFKLAPRAPATPAAPVVEQKAPVTNTGPAAAGSVTALPANPRDMSPAQLQAARASGDFARIKAEWDARNDVNRNRWAKPPAK